MKPFAPPPPPGAQPPPLWGTESHLHELFGDRADFHMLERDVLDITAFERPRDYAEHFVAYYGPTIAARANAARDGRETEFDAALVQSATSGTVAPPPTRASRRSTSSPLPRSDSAGPGIELPTAEAAPPDGFGGARPRPGRPPDAARTARWASG